MKYTEHIIIGVTYTQRSRVFRVLYVSIHVEITHIAQEHIEHLSAQEHIEHMVHMKYIEHIITYTQRSRVFRALFILHIGQKTHIAHGHIEHTHYVRSHELFVL